MKIIRAAFEEREKEARLQVLRDQIRRGSYTIDSKKLMEALAGANAIDAEKITPN